MGILSSILNSVYIVAGPCSLSEEVKCWGYVYAQIMNMRAPMLLEKLFSMY